MSIEELQAEAEKLLPDERRRLAAYLVKLRHQERDGYRKRMAAKIDDKDPANWASLEDFDRRSES